MLLYRHFNYGIIWITLFGKLVGIQNSHLVELEIIEEEEEEAKMQNAQTLELCRNFLFSYCLKIYLWIFWKMLTCMTHFSKLFTKRGKLNVNFGNCVRIIYQHYSIFHNNYHWGKCVALFKGNLLNKNVQIKFKSYEENI